jgi:glycosidase
VERQAASPDSVLACYRQLTWLRKSSPALQIGDFAWEVRARSGVLAFWRTAPEDRVLVAINTRPTPGSINLPDDGEWQVLLSTSPDGVRLIQPGRISLRAYEAVILRPNPAD